MIRMFVRHRVADFDRWKAGYRAFEEQRQALGVHDAAYFQGADDPDDVTVWHDFEDLDSARAFADAPALAEAMRGAGVASEPEIWFVKREKP